MGVSFPSAQPGWSKVADAKLLYNESVEIEIFCDAGIDIIFRAISSNLKLRAYGSFSDCLSTGYLLPSDRRLLTTTTGEQNYLHATLNCRPGENVRMEKGIHLTFRGAKHVNNFAMISRKNLTAKHRGHTYLSTVSPLKLSRWTDREELEPGAIYEYRVDCFSSDSSFKTTCKKTIKFVKPEEFIRSTILFVGSLPDGDGIKNKFDLSANFTYDTDTQLISILGKYGLYDLYRDDLEKIKEKISNILMFHCRKVLISDSGYQIVDLGITPGGEFIDYHSYDDVSSDTLLYEFEIFAATPGSIVNKITKSNTDRSVPPYLQGAAELLESDTSDSSAYKFFNEYAIKEGTLSYGDIEKKNHPKSKLLGVETGHVSAFEVNLPSNVGIVGIQSARFVVRPDKARMIEWTYRMGNVMSFTIIKNINDQRIVIGMCHHVPTGQSTYRFLDTGGKSDAGSLSYTIQLRTINGITAEKETQTEIVQF